MKYFIIIGAVIVVYFGMAYFLDWLPFSRTSPELTPFTSTSLSQTPTLSTSLTPTSSSSTNPTQTPSLPPSSTTNGSVIFDFAITNISGSSFSRTITAQLTNAGSVDAHNVWAEVTVSSGTSSIKVNDQTSLRIDVGALLAGQTVTKRLTLSFNIIDGLKITQNGATFKMRIHSDELTETFSYNYNP